MAPPQGACGRGCAAVPNSSWGRGLFERSEFRSLSPHFSPASCYGRRSTRCAGAYSRKPLRHSVQLCLQRLAVRAPQHNGVSTPSRRSLVRNAGSPSGPGQRHPKGHARAPMVLGPFAETKGSRRAGPKPRIPFLSVILDISNRGSSVFVVGSCLWSLHSYPRHPMAPPQGACGRGCAPVPKPSWGRGLSERSEFRSPNNRDWGKGTRRATPGRPWFWVLLPKQKDLGVRGRNPASSPPPFCHPCMCSVIC